MLSARVAYGKVDSLATAEAIESFYEEILKKSNEIRNRHQQAFDKARNEFKNAATKVATLNAADEMKTQATILDQLEDTINAINQKLDEARRHREEEQKQQPDEDFFA